MDVAQSFQPLKPAEEEGLWVQAAGVGPIFPRP